MTTDLSMMLKEHAIAGGLAYSVLALGSALFTDESLFGALNNAVPVTAGITTSVLAPSAYRIAEYFRAAQKPSYRR